MKSLREQVLGFKTYEEARPILETSNVSESAHTLARTAFSIQQKQPTVAENLLKPVIQEMEDNEEKKKVQEADGGKSEQSSSTTGLEKIGSEEQAPEGMTSDTDVKDQMGVAIGEMAPPMGGYPPQQMGQTPCGGQAPPQGAPPQMTPPPQQQTQYTVQEATAIRNQFTKISEALKALDKKITETMTSQTRSLELDMGTKGMKSSGSFIKETTGNKAVDLEKTRANMKSLNDALHSGLK